MGVTGQVDESERQPCPVRRSREGCPVPALPKQTQMQESPLQSFSDELEEE